MKHSLYRLGVFTSRIFDWIAIFSGVVVAAALIYLVAARYWFNLTTTGLHTISLIAAMWLYMTGALIASKKGEHLTVEILAYRLHQPRWQKWHRFIVSLVMLVIIAMFCYWCWRMFVWGASFSTTMPSLNIPIWVPQLAIGLNAVGSFGYALRDFWRAALALRNGKQ